MNSPENDDPVVNDNDDVWTVAVAEVEGKPVIFRLRSEVPAFATKEKFATLMVISWNYEPDNDQGMPAEDVVARMIELEDLLVNAFEGVAEAFIAVIATGNGMREWQFYLQGEDAIMALINQTLGRREPYPIEISFHDDPEWDSYLSLIKMI